MALATELSTAAAARCLGVASETLRRWARAGMIPARETPLGLLFDVDVVHQVAARRERQAQDTPRRRERS